MKTVLKASAVLSILLFASLLFAGDKPLELDDSNPADGASGVALDSAIELTFSNNVVNFQIAEANAACFALADASGNPVAIEVEMADDQIEPEKKRIISVVPQAPLASGMRYVLTVSGALQAKNGSALKNDTTLSFTTE